MRRKGTYTKQFGAPYLTMHRGEARGVLQLDGPAIGRSGANDENADRWLLLRHSLGTAAERRCFTSTWFIDGPAISGWMGRYRTIQPSPRTDMAASDRAICYGACLW